MAALDATARAAIRAAYMADEASTHGAVTKADLLAAVNALDDWFEANAVVINAAIPLPARSALTTAQKARLVRYVIARRYG